MLQSGEGLRRRNRAIKFINGAKVHRLRIRARSHAPPKTLFPLPKGHGEGGVNSVKWTLMGSICLRLLAGC